MKRVFLLGILLSYVSFVWAQYPITLLVHGGAGALSTNTLTPEQEKAYHQALEEALRVGYQILKSGGTSVDAVEATIVTLEDNPLFNAGKGAVLTNEGRAELDASIMDGKTGLAGAMAGVTTIKNPIRGARAVMEKSNHVLLIGKGAEKFALRQGLEKVHPAYFFTESSYQNLVRAKKSKRFGLSLPKQETPAGSDYADKLGTVGCVALDQFGNLAAGTSTGGMNNKLYGRVGDSPIIGAGTYADNATCAVSSTGHGEYFIRHVAAYDVSALMKYKQLTVSEAADEVINKKLLAKEGRGGIIALDRKGNFTMTFNTEGMFRGYIKDDGKPATYIYGN